MNVDKREFVWEFCQLLRPGQTRTGVAWELIRVDKRQFVWAFSQLSCLGQTRARVAWELTSESLYESFLNSHVLVKREQELHESWWEFVWQFWKARVCMRVLWTVMSWSNENKSCIRVDESSCRVDKREFVWEFSQLSCPGQTRRRVAWQLMRVDKREFVWEFSQLSCPGQTRTRVAWELMRVDKREFVWEFSQLSCPGQTRTRVAWELMRVDKWEFVWEFSQLSDSWVMSCHFLNSHALSNEQKLLSTLKIFSQLKVDDSRREWATLILAWPRLTRRIFTIGVFYQIYHISHHLTRNIVMDMI